jgi:propionate CoA-transferase
MLASTERAVLQLRPEGLTVTEIAPGVDLERDVLARAEFPLLVSDQLETMPDELFRPAPMGLTLPAARPHARIAALTGKALR